jgi:lipopolysaccharide transport protein LptA
LKQTINYKKIQTLLFLIPFFLIAMPLSAKIDTKGDSPLNVTSDSMLVKKKVSIVEFKGNVIVTRDDYIIHADNITMFFTQETEKKTKKKNKIEKIVAKGNVKFFSGNRKAYAGKAVYTYQNEVLVLTENNPKVITDGNSVTGKKITLYQKDGKVTIEGGVNAIFIPENEDKQKKE